MSYPRLRKMLQHYHRAPEKRGYCGSNDGSQNMFSLRNKKNYP